jgi:acyl carrier protein
MDIDRILLDILRELKIDPVGIEPDTRLREDLEIDSTEMVEIAVAIEKRLPVSIDTDRFLALKTFGDMIDNIRVAGVPASS